MHSKTTYKCEKCDKDFPFRSLYRIHVHTHLRSKIHKCFAGSCGKEYKWLQDLHRHIQTHLKLTYGCNICDFLNAQKYLLKRHLKRHSDKRTIVVMLVVSNANGIHSYDATQKMCQTEVKIERIL